MFWWLVALASSPSPPDLSGLSGCWQTPSEAAYQGRETWLGPVDGVMVGALLGKAADQVTWEQLRIDADTEGWALFVQPKGQQQTRFGLEAHGPGRWVFTNPSHDFPQRITYERAGDTLVVKAQARDAQGVWSGIELRYGRCPAAE